MANKDLKHIPHDISENAWWYEESQGINVIVMPEALPPEGSALKGAHIRISWRVLRNALRRKDK